MKYYFFVEEFVMYEILNVLSEKILKRGFCCVVFLNDNEKNIYWVSSLLIRFLEGGDKWRFDFSDLFKVKKGFYLCKY